VRFADFPWLFGIGYALAVGVVLALGGLLLVRAMRRFGDESLVLNLTTSRAGARRATRSIVYVFALALAFVALARPQYGQGTRVVPATNLDIVVALDYSKSMYARDVTPSRSVRAKTEVSRLIANLPGARFGAVAFAGEPSAFPLTSDGSAIAQFFRQLTPNDMPVGGTSLSKALERARQLLTQEPLAKKHEKVIVLVTDGEDLQGDPVAVAKSAKEDGITVHVVQIGGRTPEPIPEVDDRGKVVGMRRAEDGTPLTTALSAEGEKQLTDIAESTGGRIVRSATGTTGIDELSKILSRWVNEELSEKVETVYADVYGYPLGAALLLLLFETFFGETRKQPKAVKPPPPRRLPSNKRFGKRAVISSIVLGAVLPSFLFVLPSCEEQRKGLFTRHSPKVDEALEILDAGDAGASSQILQTYLSTGKCEQGNIGTPESLNKLFYATFDLGLALFRVAEDFGQRFGEPRAQTNGQPDPAEDQKMAQRSEQIDCALRVVTTITNLENVPLDLLARAHYLIGNLRFLREEYKDAVTAYDEVLRLVPGVANDAGDGIGRDAAWNRAIALLREKNKPPPDAGQDGGDSDSGSPDGGSPDGGDKNQSPDGGDKNQPPDGGNQNQPPDGGPPEEPKDAGNSGQQDGGGTPPPPQPEPQKPQDSAERVLDMLDETPTLQEHEAKNRALGLPRGMEDK
jgi:Ca-activated chloride channel family protein